MTTWTKPIYKIRAIIEIPYIVRGKEKGVTTEVATFISRYKSVKDLMKNDKAYFFGRIKLKYDEKYEKTIRIKSEEIIATTNDYY